MNDQTKVNDKSHAEGQSLLNARLGDVKFEAPITIWWCNFGRYGQVTLREEEAITAKLHGAEVTEYIKSPNQRIDTDASRRSCAG